MIQSLAHDLVQQFEKQYEETLYIGLGSPASQLEGLRYSYYEALAAVQYYASQKKAKSGFLPKKAVLASAAIDQTEREKRLFDVVREGDFKQALTQCLSYIEEIAFHHPFPIVKQKMEETFILLGRMLTDFGISYERTTTFHSCSSLEN